jgi:enamine deaminase RidA (YjgF/YER057c/UK114 family)
MSTAEQRIAELGLKLPLAPKAVTSGYVPWVRTGNTLLISGQLPWKADKTLAHEGLIGEDITAEQAGEACAQATLNAIAQIKDAVGDLERVRQIVRLEGTISYAPGYINDTAKALDGASAVVKGIFGDRGLHTRMLYPVPEIVFRSPCIIVLQAEVV